MRTMICALAAAGLAAACQPDSDKNNPAIATDDAAAERAAAAPAAGASSFTEAQARDRIERAGYTSVTSLTQGADGAWMGQATMNGESVMVMVDYQGNVTTTPGAGGSMGANPMPDATMPNGATNNPSGMTDPSMPSDPATPGTTPDTTTPGTTPPAN